MRKNSHWQYYRRLEIRGERHYLHSGATSNRVLSFQRDDLNVQAKDTDRKKEHSTTLMTVRVCVKLTQSKRMRLDVKNQHIKLFHSLSSNLMIFALKSRAVSNAKMKGDSTKNVVNSMYTGYERYTKWFSRRFLLLLPLVWFCVRSKQCSGWSL